MLEQIYQDNRALFSKADVSYQEYRHRAILDFETDLKIKGEMGWQGEPTKSLFLNLKSQGFAVYLTHMDTRLDAKALKEVLGKRPSIASNDDLVQNTGCTPGALCPFGLNSQIPLLVDKRLFAYQALTYTPGLPEVTFEFAGKDLAKLLAELDNQILLF